MTDRVALDVIHGPNAVAGCRLASDSNSPKGSDRVKTGRENYYMGGPHWTSRSIATSQIPQFVSSGV